MAKVTPKEPTDQFIHSTKKWVRVLAGPGTGKSYSLKERLKHLVIDEKVDPTEILVLTFTSVAVQDLKKDIAKLNKEFEDKGLGSIEVETLHTLARKLLWGAGEKYHAMQDYEIETMLWDLEPEVGTVQKKKKMFKHCVKQNGMSASTEQEEKLIASMEAWLAQHKGTIQDSVIPKICKFIREGRKARAKLSYKYVLVDEYQDLNPDEQKFVELLTATDGCLSVIGDDDQSIYEFKGASPIGIREFIKNHPKQNDDIQFSECYRCPTKIVDMANHLIQINKERVPKTLCAHTENQEGSFDEIHASTPAEEIDQLCGIIQKEHKSPAGLKWDQIVVLTPTKERGKTLYHALQAASIPTTLCFRNAVFDQLAAQKSFSLLTLAAYPDNLIALRYLLGQGKEDRFSKCYHHIRTFAGEQHMNILDALEKCLAKTIKIPFTYTLVKRYEEIKKELEKVQKDPLYLLAILGSEDSDYKEILRDIIAKARNKADFRKLRQEVLKTVYSPLTVAPSNRVRIMSLHSAKGLSANMVIIMSAVENMIPLRNAGTVEEQRRLFYVAITRCKGGKKGEYTKDHQPEYPGKLIISVYDNSEAGDREYSLTRFVNEMRV